MQTLKHRSRPKTKPLLCYKHYGIPNLPLDEVAAEGTAAKPRVLLLTDDPQVRADVSAALSPGGFQLQILTQPDELRLMGFPPSPTCLLCSHLMNNGISGFDVLNDIHERGFLIPTLFMAADWNINLVVQAVKSGADDFLRLPLDAGCLRAAVEQALQDALLRWDLSRAIAVARNRVATLDKRESEVVRLVLNGFLNKEIANALDLALVTVKVYRARAMKKLGAGNASEMVRIVGLAGMCDEAPIPRPG
jgi:FixJ family two-component response regulator